MKKYLLVIGFLLSLVSLPEDCMAQEAEATKDHYSFGGHVFAEDFPIVNGEAYLYDAETYERIEMVKIDTLGYYYFYRKPAGDYYVWAGLVPGDPNMGNFSYTLYQNGSNWQEAEIIHLTEDYWEYDIKLIRQNGGETLPNGPGVISGTISSDVERSTLQGIDVILFNENMVSLMHIPTNHLGHFSFNNLPLGSYIVYPHIIGLNTNQISITISEENTQFEDIQISVEDGFISSSINEELISEDSFNFYPNPANSIVNIEFTTTGNKSIQTRVSDISGRIVFEESSKLVSNTYSKAMHIRNWQNGYYFVEVYVDETLATTQKLIISH